MKESLNLFFYKTNSPRSQFIPIACLYEALPVLMRQRGASLEAIGYQGVFIISIAIALLSIAIVAREFDRTRRTQLTPQIE